MTTTPSKPQIPASVPHDDLGNPIEPAPHFHDWDPTPHAIFPLVGVGHVDLGDVILGGTHQVEGKGRAEQRGTPAVRFDLEYLVGPTMEGSARLILPVDHQLEVKRYFPNGPHYAWVKLDSEQAQYPAGLVPDFGPDTHLCGCGPESNDSEYDPGATLCDACVDSWEIDHDVVRHEYRR